ncbi:hypothetical protein CDL15_Pgr022156 [Punica granatum]|uniref:Uncharacterized protein n=1 Tax=Punica granatum TaxID=22663 RepID=A0A218VTS1_PUNGR|nr:hypothetical protein CDL15_Pgr022156 [Punica granatum]
MLVITSSSMHRSVSLASTRPRCVFYVSATQTPLPGMQHEYTYKYIHSHTYIIPDEECIVA